MGTVIAGSDFRIEHGQRRVLLVNPPVYDLRLDWPRWQQPCGLLQLGATLRERGADVRLLDFVSAGSSDDGRVTRRQVETFQIDGEDLAWWCYGLPWQDAGRIARQWRAEGWRPDEVWVTSLTSFWRRGAQDVIRRVKYDWWPEARVLLGGVYPTLYPGHAAAHTDADLIVTGPVEAALPGSDLTLYSAVPASAGVYLYRGGRSADDVVNEIAAKARQGVREFAFFDDDIPGPDPDRFDYVLQGIVQRRLKVRLAILGNLRAQNMTESRAAWLYAAGLAEAYLCWDPALNGDMQPHAQAAYLLETYAGFKARDGALSAIVHAGWPGENLQDTAAHLLHLSHAVGSVTIFPYQATVEEGARLALDDPDQLNGKLFPFAAANGVCFADYADLLRLAATLNSKYRDVTFDFLGDNLIARMVRHSIRRQAWQPAAKDEDNGTRIFAETDADTSAL
jgi:hypothetical protein